MKSRITKFIVTAVAATALAVPAVASAEYHANENASCNGQAHGTFGALGEKSSRHDLGQGDTTVPGSDQLGADGPATGANNSGAAQYCASLR